MFVIKSNVDALFSGLYKSSCYQLKVKFYNHNQVFTVDELDLLIRAIWKSILRETQTSDQSELKVETLNTTFYIRGLMKAKRDFKCTSTTSRLRACCRLFIKFPNIAKGVRMIWIGYMHF